LVVGACEDTVHAALALEVVSALSVSLDSVESVADVVAPWVLTPCWELRLTSPSVSVEVCVGLTLSEGVDTIITVEICCADGVSRKFEVTIPNAGTSWVCASRWESGLALSVGRVEVLVGWASGCGVDAVVATEVGSAQVVVGQDVVSIDTVVATRI